MDLPVHGAPLPRHGDAQRLGPTRQLANFIAGIGKAEIDDFARRAACRHLIDTLGAMIAGAPQESTKAVLHAYRLAGVPEGKVQIPGMGQRFDALHAAYVSASASHGLEVDDGYRPGSVHPGTVVIPAALALAASIGASGETLVRAIVDCGGVSSACALAGVSQYRDRRGVRSGGGGFGAVGL